MAAIEHKLLRGQAAEPGFFIDDATVGHQFLPAGCRLYIDLDNAWVRRYRKAFKAVVMRRLVAFHEHGHIQLFGGGFDGVHQVEVVLQVRQRRQENIQVATTRFDTQGGMDDVYQVVFVCLFLGISRCICRNFRVDIQHLFMVAYRAGGSFDKLGVTPGDFPVDIFERFTRLEIITLGLRLTLLLVYPGQ